MSKSILSTAAISGALAVCFGAFGAHMLKNMLDVSSIQLWKTAVEYQFYHTLALAFLAIAPNKLGRFKKLSALFFTLGIILFSGSLYLLALRGQIIWLNATILGPITPLGGLSFILGWICLLIAVLRK